MEQKIPYYISNNKGPYYIGNIEFKTIKECENYTRNKIGKQPLIIKNDDPNYQFFNDLINKHSECELKIGTGIKSFEFITNPMNKNAMHGIIKRIDGTNEYYSWLHCCRNNKKKQKTVDHTLFRAMRQAVKEDTIKFKQQQSILKCNLCSVIELPYSEFHVDHSSPPFREIKDSFLKTSSSTLPTIFSRCSTTKTSIFSDDDWCFEKEWFHFHRENAKFQILCKTCNLKKH